MTLAVTRRPDPDQHGGPIPSTFGLYRMLVSWGEGTGSGITGSPAKFGEATWSTRFYPLVTWDFPGGGAGVDYVNSPSSSAAVDNVGTYVLQSTPSLIADVETWVNDPSTNSGFMLISDNESTLGTGRRFASKETATVTQPAPIRTVTYSVPESSPGLLAALGLTGCFAFKRQRGKNAARSANRIT